MVKIVLEENQEGVRSGSGMGQEKVRRRSAGNQEGARRGSERGQAEVISVSGSGEKRIRSV